MEDTARGLPDSHRMPPHIFAMFCQYRDMPRRNLKVLAEDVGLSHWHLRRISSKHNWRERIRDFDRFVQERVTALDIDETAEARRQQLSRVRTGIISLGNQLLDERFGLYMKDKDLVSSFTDLVKLDRLLTGESTENTQQLKSHEDALDELDD